MGGEISLTSRLHQGSTFWFTLRLSTTDMPMTELIGNSMSTRQTAVVDRAEHASRINHSVILTQEGLVATYRSVMPDESTPL